MSFIGGIVKEALSVKIKSRHDGVTDQFSRIFMSKMFIISAFVMSIDFFSDRVSCIVSSDVKGPKEFVHSACWISGFYVYANIPYDARNAYYGMPKNIREDGTKDGKICSRIDKSTLSTDEKCEPLKRLYYAQYQYFSFYIASLAVMSYLPYIFFRALNADIISMKGNMKKDDEEVSVKASAHRITDHYFNHEANGGVAVLRLKTFANVLLKAIYVFINIGGFLFTDRLLHNKFIDYGAKWVRWSGLENSKAYDNKHLRGFPKPGNELLPTMGFCDLTVSSADRSTSTLNDHRFVCEISTHILYQYVLLVLWFIYVAGILMSTIGFILHLIDIIVTLIKCALPKSEFHQKFGFDLFLRDPMYKACKKLTVREIEYMKYIREHDYGLYHGIVRIIQPECVLDLPTRL